MPVGGFPGLTGARRRTHRAPVNPLDKSTVVSIYPREILERKPTIQPGVFHIMPGTYEHPSFLVVGPSSWWKEVDEEQPLLEIPNSSIQVADAVVKDYCNGLIGCNMTSSMPGIFWVPGEHDEKSLRREHSGRLEKARAQQLRYYNSLVKMADSLWARTNGNPLVISDDMRLAAKGLNLTQKDWMKDFTMQDNVSCKACGHLVKPGFPVCPNCHAIVNLKQAEELGIQFATK